MARLCRCGDLYTKGAACFFFNFASTRYKINNFADTNFSPNFFKVLNILFPCWPYLAPRRVRYLGDLGNSQAPTATLECTTLLIHCLLTFLTWA